MINMEYPLKFGSYVPSIAPENFFGLQFYFLFYDSIKMALTMQYHCL